MLIHCTLEEGDTEGHARSFPSHHTFRFSKGNERRKKAAVLAIFRVRKAQAEHQTGAARAMPRSVSVAIRTAFLFPEEEGTALGAPRGVSLLS